MWWLDGGCRIGCLSRDNLHHWTVRRMVCLGLWIYLVMSRDLLLLYRPAFLIPDAHSRFHATQLVRLGCLKGEMTL
jgi:hypothetical protein